MRSRRTSGVMLKVGRANARNAEPVDPAIGTTHMCQCIFECGLLTGTRSAEGIMASGHANRANRPNTWLWPDRYFVPGEVRGYCTIGAPSRVGGDGAMVSGGGGL